LVVLGVVVVGGVALAFWSGRGGGAATQEVDDVRALAVVPGEVEPELQPGGTGTVAIRLRNPNPFQVFVPSLQLDVDGGEPITVEDAGAGGSGCQPDSFSYEAQDNGGSGWFVPPSIGGVDGTLLVELRDSVRLSVDAPDACQGANVLVRLKAGA
jgi:hypothetical protein